MPWQSAAAPAWHLPEPRAAGCPAGLRDALQGYGMPCRDAEVAGQGAIDGSAKGTGFEHTVVVAVVVINAQIQVCVSAVLSRSQPVTNPV